MSASRRKPRPLDRDRQSYRDDRLYLVACDDRYAPKQYFHGFERDFLGARLQVKVIPTEDSTSAARYVLDRLLEFEVGEGDQLWLMLDTDHYTRGTHLRSFIEETRRARQRGVHVAISRPCFEFWLLLHHVDAAHEQIPDLPDAKAVLAMLKKVLGTYNKTKLDPSRFPLSSVPQAMTVARELDGDGSDHIPEVNTSRVYRLWEEIVRNASLAQLPSELHTVKASLCS